MSHDRGHRLCSPKKLAFQNNTIRVLMGFSDDKVTGKMNPACLKWPGQTLDWNPGHLHNTGPWLCKTVYLLFMKICELVLLDLSPQTYFSDRVSLCSLHQPQMQAPPGWSFWNCMCVPPCPAYNPELIPPIPRLNTRQSLTSNFRTVVLILFLWHTIPFKYFQNKYIR